MPFVEVNDRILDYKHYRRKVLLLRKKAEIGLKEALVPHGFRKRGQNLYHPELDIEVEIKFHDGDLSWI